MSIRVQILIPTLVVILAFVAINWWSGEKIIANITNAERVTTSAVKAKTEASELLTKFNEMDAAIMEILSMTTFVSKEASEKTFADFDKSISQLLEQIKSRSLGESTNNAVTVLAQTYRDWHHVTAVLLGLKEADEIPTMELLDRSVNQVRAANLMLTRTVNEAAISVAKSSSQSISDSIKSSFFYGSIVAALCLLISWIVSMGVGRPLKKLTIAMSKMTDGDYAVDIPTNSFTRELKSIYAAVEVFRQNGIEREKLTEESSCNQRIQVKRTADLQALLSEMNHLISAANSGNFDIRMSNEFDDEELTKAQNMMNSLIESLNANMSATSRIMQAVAEGDLSERLDSNKPGTFGSLNLAINTTVDNLANLISSVSDTSNTIGTISEKLNSDSEQLASRSEQQAASVEETAAALVEISQSTDQVSDRASAAQSLAAETRSKTSTTQTVVKDAVSAMNKIESASQEIGQIISVIDEIAFQTNLLALNAGVEAARAGEAGKGFAVVAQEVRELAQRSAASANDIKMLIDRTRSEIDEGVSLVQKTGESLVELKESVVGIDGQINEISTTILDQSAAISNINSTVQDIDHIAQKNATMVRDTTSEVNQLSSHTGTLVSLLGRFRSSDDKSSYSPDYAKSA